MFENNAICKLLNIKYPIFQGGMAWIGTAELASAVSNAGGFGMIHRQDGYAVFKVAAQDLQRGSLRILSNSSLDESPTVAPNGTMVIYATHQQGRGVLMLASIYGRVRLPLPSVQGEVREPSWSPYLN